jgi:hypothetical protein
MSRLTRNGVAFFAEKSDQTRAKKERNGTGNTKKGGPFGIDIERLAVSQRH